MLEQLLPEAISKKTTSHKQPEDSKTLTIFAKEHFNQPNKKN